MVISLSKMDIHDIWKNRANLRVTTIGLKVSSKSGIISQAVSLKLPLNPLELANKFVLTCIRKNMTVVYDIFQLFHTRANFGVTNYRIDHLSS